MASGSCKSSWKSRRQVLCALLFAVLTVACGDEKTEMVSMDVDPETVPTMVTRDVITMISDSGVTRYRINTPLWLVFDEAAEPSWHFPDGMYIEKFDDDFATDATIVCDSAVYLKNKALWRLDGNVNILNTVGEKFLTQQLFWNQREHKVYSDSFIHIERADRVIEGYGFNSNDRMTTYTIRRPSGIFPVSDFKARRDTTPNDSNERDITTVATD